MKRLLLILIFASSVSATSGRISAPVQLCSPCARAFPCLSAACNTYNSGAEIVYDAYTSSSGCAEMWSMHTDGTNKINLTILLFGLGFGYDPGSNQGAPA